MKINLPVTEAEHRLKPGQPIVSSTDLKGAITYANQSFIDISGFERDELIGKSHNLVRHPDMPPEAFADLWDTVKQDQPWRGIVKNRCKNGDFYWVEAYVTPIKENGRTVGYMSVRSAPAAEQIASAEKLYRDVKAGKAKIPRTLRRKSLLPSLVNQLSLSFGLLALLLIATSVVGMRRGDMPLLLGLSLFGATFALIAGIWLRRTLGGGFSRAIESLDLLAEGNFNVRVDVAAAGELSHLLTALESMRINTRAIIADVMHSARVLEEVAQWLKREMREVRERSSIQSGRAIVSTQELKGMLEFIQSLSENTHETVMAATQARGLVDTGNQQMSSSRTSSQRVVTVVGEARDTVESLNEAIEKIGAITETIREIADQTNLLALNASIEAARAGEQGRGFAVVADEVRKLAERTAISTQDITHRVEEIQQATLATIASMGGVAEQVEHGTTLIQASSDSLQEILGASNRTADLAHQIESGIQQQFNYANSAVSKMLEISELADNNSLSIQGIEEVTVNLLGRTAGELKQLVLKFEKSL